MAADEGDGDGVLPTRGNNVDSGLDGIEVNLQNKQNTTSTTSVCLDNEGAQPLHSKVFNTRMRNAKLQCGPITNSNKGFHEI